MEWLTPLDHDVVRDVYKIVECADTSRLQAPTHPGRRRRTPYPGHHSRRITRAQIWIFDPHAGLLSNSRATFAHLGLLGVQAYASEGRNFSGEPEDAEAVTAIGGDRYIEDGVAHTKE